jgi:diguanylate cyclase (GGDEF)-like protein
VLDATVVTGSSDPSTFATYFVVVFVWVGIGHPRWTAIRLSPLALAAYVVPLVATGEPDRAFDSVFEVMVLCVLIGEAIAWVSESLRVAEVVDERQSRQMAMLVRAAELLAREHEPGRLPQLVGNLAVQLLRAEGAAILIAEGDGGLRPLDAVRWPGGLAEGPVAPSPQLREVLDGDGVALLDRERAGRELGLSVPFPRILAMPLAGTTRPQGILIVGPVEATLDAFARDAAATFATQAGLALERVRAAQALLEESLRDELTTLGNRRYANLALADSSVGDAIVIIDLDHFKELNDARGHAAGDEVLRSLAGHLRSALRENDTAARLGGDEFLLILRGAGDNARATLERLEQQWRAGHHPVAYSAGIAVRVADETADQALMRADHALYAAKEQGRDRVTVAM